MQQSLQEREKPAPSLQGSPREPLARRGEYSRICNKVFKNEKNLRHHYKAHHENPSPSPVFLNVNGDQESIPRNEFRQPM
jgi:hypothetical protein